MSNKNYRTFDNAYEIEKEEVAENLEQISVDQVENVQEEIQKIGVITDCLNLNVRKEPNMNAEIVCEIKCNSEVMIDDNESIDEFYKICTASGIEGYCMKKYVSIRQ